MVCEIVREAGLELFFEAGNADGGDHDGLAGGCLEKVLVFLYTRWLKHICGAMYGTYWLHTPMAPRQSTLAHTAWLWCCVKQLVNGWYDKRKPI